MAENQTPFDEFLNCDYASIGDFLFSLSGFEYGVIGALLGLFISTKLTINQDILKRLHILEEELNKIKRANI